MEAYARNRDFRGETVILPEPLDPDWPCVGFHQLQQSHKILLPKLSTAQVDGYFEYRLASDSHAAADIKAIEKGKRLLEGRRVYACSIHVSTDIFFSGIVGAAMKKKVTCSYKIKINKQTGEVKNSHCECPSGKGPHGTCKHIASVLLMLVDFISSGSLRIQRTCTESLQTHHQPKRKYVGSLAKAETMPAKKICLDDPRPDKLRNWQGYEDHVRNSVVNYCSKTSKDLTMRYL